jgi:sigma-B regulation protein RsbU (phosphoserine phosphatase)
MDDLAELLVQEFHFDLVMIHLLDNDGQLTVRTVKGSVARTRVARNLSSADNAFISEAFHSNRPQFANDTSNIPRYRGVSATPSVSFASFAHIPLTWEGETATGVLSVCSTSIIGLFTEPFLNLLASLAGQLTQAVKIVEEREAKERERKEKDLVLMENARVAREMELAKQIQLSLLPASIPLLPGTQFACRCIPAAHVGGDYYDFFSRDSDILDMLIADVSGHDVGAALIMVETRSVLRAQVHNTTSTKEVLTLLNELLYEDLNRAELFISMFYLKYDAGQKKLTYSSAGHNHPLLFRARDGASCQELDAEGLIMGVKERVEFEEREVQLQSGDILVLYTDGLTEAASASGELFGSDRLCQVIYEAQGEPVEVIMEAIFREVTAHTGRQTLEDDASVVIMKVGETG